MRTDITFQSGDDCCAGWLYRPEGFEGPRPLMVMAHGFSGTKELRLPAYAERFCAAGIGVLLFDYRHFGASGGEPRQLLDISRQHADFRRALAYARDLEWVDPERVGLFGSSFSGGHVLAVGAADGRVAAIVSQCPFTDGLATLPALGLKTIMRVTVAGLRDQVTALRRGAPYYIPAAAPPGSLGVMTTDDGLSGMTAIVEQSVDAQWDNRVAARIALRMGMYRPGLKAAKLPARRCSASPTRTRSRPQSTRPSWPRAGRETRSSATRSATSTSTLVRTGSERSPIRPSSSCAR